MTMIIGLCGKKGSGKDTCADHLVQQYGFHKISFAQPLKKVCQDLFLFSEEQCTNPLLKEIKDPRWGISPREAFQLVGTDWIRHQFHSSFWILRMKWQLQELLQHHNKIVISDVRFENEKQFVQAEMKGHVLGIERQSDVYSSNDTHPSEIESDQFWSSLDSVLINDSTMEAFYQKIDVWFENIVNKTI